MPAQATTAAAVPTIRFGAADGTASIYFDLPSNQSWTAALAPAFWLHLEPDSAPVGRGPGFLSLTCTANTGPARTSTLTIAAPTGDPLLAYPVAQISAEPLAILNASVLAIPFPTTPRVLELGIAGKFVTAQIRKIPEPFNLIALVIAELVVVSLGLIAILLRAAFAAKVPEPRTWLGAPPTFEKLTATLPATAICITEETYLLALYILKSQS
jgi:hypothetical protein